MVVAESAPGCQTCCHRTIPPPPLPNSRRPPATGRLYVMLMSVTPTRWLTVPCWLRGMPCAAAGGAAARTGAASTTNRRNTLEAQLEADAQRAPRAVEAPRPEERIEIGAQRLGLLGDRVEVIPVAESLLHALQGDAVDRGRSAGGPLRAIAEVNRAVGVELADGLRLSLNRQATELRPHHVRTEQAVRVSAGLAISADVVGEVENVARVSVDGPGESPGPDAFGHPEVQGLGPGQTRGAHRFPRRPRYHDA